MPLALIRKELRQLMPWALLIVILELGAHGLNLLLTPPDELVWAELTPLFQETGLYSGLTLLVAALLFAYSGFPREHDDGTLPFLLALPLSRARLFGAKLVAAAALLAAIVIGEELASWLLQLPNPTTFGQTFRLDWALASAGTGVALAWILLGHALFLSVFRRFGLLLALLAIAVVEWWVSEQPSLRRISPFDLRRVEFEGSHALVPYAALLAHLLVAACLAAVAGWAWVGPTERAAAALSRGAAKPGARWAFIAMLVVTLISLALQWAEREEGSGSTFGKVLELEGPEATLLSARFEFRYRSPLRERVQTLAAAADGVHDAIARELGAELPRERIVVSLLRSSPTHAGSATWESIRLDLVHAADDRALLRTLAHESSHVVALRASDRRTLSHAGLGFFDEGLAELVSLRRVPDEAYRGARSLEAALQRRRLRIEFQDLLDYEKFRQRFGEGAVYPLGLAWVEALTTVCGEDAPKRVLQTLARPETPRDVPANALWQHVLRAVGCDLSRVNAVWGDRVEHDAVELAAETDRVPSLLGGAPRWEGEALLLHAELDRAPLAGAVYHALLRIQIEGRDDVQAFSGELGHDRALAFSVPELYADAESIEYQLVVSWERQGARLSFAGEWQRAILPPR